ncbi:hypothetical protein [Rhodopseudomonas sp.]|uniref:hypothetical protein n=1 Tax=Rhodopseudomonas sp. TaxID=1078 RepID=UPI0025E14008|nr:hypothetical protein [Rhodopseudomonas sp.]
MVGAPRRLRITRRRIHAVLAGIVAAATVAPASAQQPAPFSGVKAPPFTATLSNTTPLAFGMDAEDAARALGMPLHYISGRPGDEIYLVFRPIGGSGFFNRSDRLFLQFRRGQLAGWKGDWGRNWMWH